METKEPSNLIIEPSKSLIFNNNTSFLLGARPKSEPNHIRSTRSVAQQVELFDLSIFRAFTNTFILGTNLLWQKRIVLNVSENSSIISTNIHFAKWYQQGAILQILQTILVTYSMKNNIKIVPENDPLFMS